MSGRVNTERVEIEEVTSVLRPAPGVPLARALADAGLTGYERVELHDEVAVITWYQRRADQSPT